MIISIEGNIGSGKSTFCNYLRDHFSKKYNSPNGKKVYFADEPVKDWESIKGPDGNLLECFYKNQEKYAYCFQMTAYISRLVKLKDILSSSKPDDIIITERCVFSDYNVFAKMLKASGKIDEIEFQAYKQWFDYFISDIPQILYVYLKTDYNNCYDRVRMRARSGEATVSKSYLETCEEYHEEWLKDEKYKLVLDGNSDTSVHPKYTDILKQIMCYNTDYPSDYNSDDSCCEYYTEKHFEKEKWNKRLFNRSYNKAVKRAKNN